MVKKKKPVKKTKTTLKRKIVKRKTPKKILPKKPKEDIIGVITHYFPKVRAGVVKIKKPLSLGERIRIKGHTTDFTQTVTSMQINHVPIKKAKRGDEIGLLVDSRVRRNDLVYKEKEG